MAADTFRKVVFLLILRCLFSTHILVGSFAVWGTLFSICDCTFTYIRKKEDPWNAIASGAATGGLSNEILMMNCVCLGRTELQ